MSSTITSNKNYYIMNAKTQTVLDVLAYGGPGTSVVGAKANWSLTPQRNNIWQAQQDPDGNWRFMSVATGNYMYFQNNDPLQSLITGTTLANTDQLWKLNPIQDANIPTFFNIVNAANGLYVDLANGNPDQGAAVLAQHQTGDFNQSWVFIESN